MKRDQALNRCIDIVSINGRYIPEMLEKLEYFIDEIYDDFESRVCKNCKYFNEDEGCTNELNTLKFKDMFGKWEEPLYLENMKNFGCNRFEKKKN